MFVIPGKPVAKGRPRITVRGRYAVNYTPHETVDFENRVRVFAQPHFTSPSESAVSVIVRAYWPCKSPRKREPRAAEHKTTKPDGDNVAKAVLDGLSGIAYVDDAQVVRLEVEKWYAAQGDGARVEVEVREL